MMLKALQRLIVLKAITLLILVSAARAQEWVGTADSNWTNANNWNPASVPVSGSTATFDNDGAMHTNISLGATSQPINTIAFSTANAAAYNIGVLNSGDALNFDAGGTISVDSAVTNVETINAHIATSGDMNIFVSTPPTAPGLKLEGGIDLASGSFLNLGPTGTTSGSGASGAVTIDKPITGDGFLNSTIRTGSLNINAQNTYSGGTFFNATNSGEQPAIRFSVNSVGSPGAVTSGPFGTGTITTQSGNPVVLQPVGGDRTIANDWTFVNAFFVGTVVSAPYLTGETGHNLFLTGNVTLGASGRVLTNNLPAGTALYFGGSTVGASPSNLTLSNRLSFQTQAISGTDGGVAIINDPIINGSGIGAITAQNNATVVINNSNNTYTGTTLLQGATGLTAPRLIVNGAITGGGNVVAGFNATSNGAILGGTGSVSPSLVVIARNSILSPGLRTLTAAENDSLTNIGTFGTGPLAMRGGTQYYFQLNSTGTPTADLLNVNGTLSLQCTVAACPGGTAAQVGAGPDTTGATLTLKDLAPTSTALSLGTKFTLMSYAGAWDNTTFGGLANGGSLTVGANTFKIKYDDTSAGLNGGLYSNFVTLTVAAPPGVPGDYNGNGVVDAADYVVWRKNLGTNTQLANEVSGVTPGQVTQEDYDAWRTRFGNTSGAGSSLGVGAVPEPSAVLLVLSSLYLGVGFQRKQRRSNRPGRNSDANQTPEAQVN